MPTRRASIILTFFLLGACSVTCQATLVREFLTVFSGNELCLGAFFGIWLFWIAVGAGLGSLVARLPRGLLAIFIIGVLVAGVSPLAQVYAIRNVRAIFNMPIAGLLLGLKPMLLFALCCLGPFSSMIGLTFPIGCRLYEGQSESKAAGIGWVYVAESVGFLCGGIVFSFVLVHSYNAMAVASGILLLTLLTCLVLVADGAGPKARRACAGLGLAFLMVWACLYPNIQQADSRTIKQRWYAMKTGGELLESIDSKYENLALGLREGQYEAYASGSPAFHFPDKYEFPVVAQYVLTQHPHPRDLLIVGNAAHGLIKEFLVEGSPLLYAEDVLDWPALCSKLSADAAQEPSPAKTLWALLPRQVQQTVSEAAKGKPMPEKQQADVVDALNNILARRDLAQKEGFAAVRIPAKQTGSLHRDGGELSDQQAQRLNRLLLEASFPRAIAKCPDTGVERLDHVDLDPQVLGLIRPYLPEQDKQALKSPKVRQHYVDGRHYVKTCKRRYDLIFVNVADPSTAMLNRYYTREFFAELKRILRPDGVVAITTSCSYSYIGDLLGDFVGSIYHTLRKEFRYLVMNPGDHSYIFASNAPDVVTSDPDVLADRFLDKGIESETFTEHHFAMLFPGTTTEQLRREMMARSPDGPPAPGPSRQTPVFQRPESETAGRRPAKLNTDLKPVSYFFNLLMWDKYTNSGLHRFFRRIEQTRPAAVLACLAALVLLRLAYVAALGKSVHTQIRFNALASITVCGFSGMAIDILMLFAYQNLFGYLYHMVGLLVALFMLGLAVGGACMNLALPRVRDGAKALIGLQAGLMVYAFALPGLIAGIASLLDASAAVAQVAFMALVALAGMIAGAQFPLVAKLYLDRSSGTAAAAGLVDAGDHFGACAGALVSGTVLMPILGMVATCTAVGTLNIACAVLVVFTTIGRRSQ